MEMSAEQLGASNVAIGACGVALATLAVVAAHQVGVVDHLPDPPGAVFGSDEITESKAAHPLGIPDGLLGLMSFGVTMALLVAARKSALARGVLRVKLGVDASVASANVVRQVVSFGKVCSWCTGTAVATGVMVRYGRKSLED